LNTGAVDGGPVLEVDGLVRRFATGRTIGPFSLSLAKGERVSLTGPNGSGKSTILRCVVGTVEPTEGELSVAGHSGGSLEAKSCMGVSLSQERSFDLRLTGQSNLVIYSRLRHETKVDAQESVRALVAELALEEIVPLRVDQCSTGMVQQLALARALVGEPSLLLLDEPTRSLDEEAVERLWGALERRPQTAVVIATHRQEDIARCDRRVSLAE
jgi:ABC-type multidrug transport system ATPase subunit